MLSSQTRAEREFQLVWLQSLGEQRDPRPKLDLVPSDDRLDVWFAKRSIAIRASDLV